MMGYIITFAIVVTVICIICLDIGKKINLRHKNFMSIYFFFAPHIVLMGYFFSQHTKFRQDKVICKWIIIVEIILFTFYAWIKVNIVPHAKNQIVNIRLRIMSGGRSLVVYGLYTAFIQSIMYLIVIGTKQNLAIPRHIFIMTLLLRIQKVD